jgi:hypothetical protein
MWSNWISSILGDGADVARDRLAHLDLRLAAQQVEVAGLDRLLASPT